MILYRTELDSGLNSKQFLVPSSALGLNKTKKSVKCVLSCNKTSTGYRIYGSAFYQAKFSCDRCLNAYEKKIKAKIDILLTNNKNIAKEKNTDVILFTMSDGFIDLSSILRDIIIVEKPFKSLCGDNCKGICYSCGLDLNLRQCNCKFDSSLNEFKELKNLIK